MKINIRRAHPDALIPEYKTSGAVAFDLAVIEGGVLAPNEYRLFRTGIVIAVPEGHALILAPRSSNGKKGIRLANSIGVIDQDFCGNDDELRLVLHNFGNTPYTVEPGERLAQGLIMPITKVTFAEVDNMGTPNRGGFGTTG